ADQSVGSALRGRGGAPGGLAGGGLSARGLLARGSFGVRALLQLRERGRVALAEFAQRARVEVQVVGLAGEPRGAHESGKRYLRCHVALCLIHAAPRVVPGSARELAQLPDHDGYPQRSELAPEATDELRQRGLVALRQLGAAIALALVPED